MFRTNTGWFHRVVSKLNPLQHSEAVALNSHDHSSFIAMATVTMLSKKKKSLKKPQNQTQNKPNKTQTMKSYHLSEITAFLDMYFQKQ